MKRLLGGTGKGGILLVLTLFLFIGMLCGGSSWAQEQPQPASLIVKLVPGLSSDDQAAVFATNGGTPVSSIPALRLTVVQVPAAELPTFMQSYQNDPRVERVEENKVRKIEALPTDPLYSTNQWALAKIGWESVFGTVVPTGAARVAILDTGVDANHPDLAGKVLAGTSVLDGSNGQTDLNGHGTLLAGIVAANTDNNLGIAGIGYAGVQILPVTVLSSNGLGQDSDIIAGVIWAADNGADVILMGFSNPGFSNNLQDAIDYAWSRNIVLVASTGNDGQNAPTFPAGHRGVMGVSATDSNDAMAAFSNYGQAVFLAAPGTGIAGTELNNGYVEITGTSPSAAIVAGVAAFMRAVDPALSNAVIISRIARTTDPAGTVEQTGNGRINMARALADTSTEGIQPAGAAPVGGGGPFVGPYVASARQLTVTFSGTGGGSVTITVPAGDTVKADTSCGGTGTKTTSQTITSTCNNIDLSNNSATGSLSASPNANSFFSSWTSGNNFSGCSATNPCSFSVSGSSPVVTVTFNQKANTTTIGSNATAAYGAASVTLNATVTSTSTVNEGTVTFNVKNGANLIGTVTSSTVISGAASASFLLAGVNANTYTLEAVYNPAATNPKFNTSSDTSKTLTINKATPTVNVTGGTYTYDGNPHPATGSVTGVGGANLGTPTFTYTPGASNAPVNAGTYSVTGSFAGNDNYNPASGGPATITIDKATATFNVVGWTGTYDGNAHGASGTATGVGGANLSASLNFGAMYTNVPGGTAHWTFAGGTNYNDASGDVAIVINKADATVTLSNLNQTYNGSALTPTVTTVPASLAIGWTNAPQTAAGDYQVTATVNDANYQGSDNGTFVISKANATINVVGWTGNYDGNAHGASGTATGVGGVDLSASLNFGATYTNVPGGTAHWTFAGGANYNDASGDVAIVINKATATITLGSLSQTYDGTSKSATATTNPLGLSTVTFTYDGSATAPTNAGSYAVVATLDNPNYQGTASGTLVISKATAIITWNNPADIVYGTALSGTQLNATASVPGSFIYTPAAGTVPPAGSGQTLSVAFTPADTTNYNGASATVRINVSKASTSVAVSSSKSPSVPGDLVTFTATVTPNSATGTVDFFDGATLLGTQTLSGGSASVSTSSLSVGNHSITAIYNGDGNFVGSTSAVLNQVVDNPAVAVADVYTVFVNDQLSIGAPGVLINDYDVNAGQMLTAIKVTDPAYGTVTLNVDGSFVYTPGANFTGIDTFTYKVNDGVLDGDPTMVTITVLAEGATPVAANDAYRAQMNTVLNVAAAGVLANDNGQTLTAIKVTDPAHGAVTLNVDGSFVYTPSADFTGTDSFIYKAKVNGGTAESNLAMVTIAVQESTDSPVTDNDVYSVDEGLSLNKDAIDGLLANDLPLVSLTATLVSGPLYGALNLQPNGSFTYTPDLGFSGVDSFLYRAISGTGGSTIAMATITVRATPVISWSNPGDITYGTSLDGTQLNATAAFNGNPVPGTFTYTPTAGAVLSAGDGQNLSVTFTPTDTVHYTNASATVMINVLKATPTITWANPSDITYGTALSATQLNASASVAGSFVYTPVSGAVLNAGNGQALKVDFTPTDTTNYNTASKTVNINVLKATPTITWANPADITYPAALSATQLNATASVAGTFVYSPVSGTVLNAGNGQTLLVNFTPTDAANYNLASASVLINVLKATPTLTWSNPGGIIYGTALSVAQLNANASVPGSFTYTPTAGTILGAGSGQSLTVLFTPTDTANYNPASASVLINVLKATPTITWSNPGDIIYGTALSGAQLNANASVPGSFTYTPTAGTILGAGSGQSLTVLFTPTDTANYNPASASVLINVLKATPTITWSNPADITYPGALSPTQLNATTSVPGSFVYTPPAGTVLNAGNGQTLSVNFTATDTANYNPASASVLINVLKATPTVSVTGGIFTYNGQPHPATGFAYGLGGTTDVLSPAVTFIYQGTGSTTYGPTETAATNSGTYQVTANFAGNMNYASAFYTASITINPAAPHAQPQTLATDEDIPLDITLRGRDIDSSSLTFSIVDGPSNGSLMPKAGPDCTPVSLPDLPGAISCTATVTYKPTGDYHGPDSFTFKVNDGALESDTMMVSITVNPVNDSPMANSQSVTADNAFFLAITLTANDLETSSSNLKFTIVTPPGHGTLKKGDQTLTTDSVFIGSPADVTYMPDSSYKGPDNFTFTVTDRGDPDNCSPPSLTCAASKTSPPATVSITVTDGTAPTTALTTLVPVTLSNDPNPRFGFTGTDNVTETAALLFECSLDGGTFSPCGSPGDFTTQYTGLADGPHTFEVRAKDDVSGNTDMTPASYTWTIDATLPDTEITSQPPPLANNSTATFSFKSTEAGTFLCSIDGGTAVDCGNGTRTYTVSDGSHTFTVAAKDQAGNIDQTPASYTWIVDTAAPQTSIISGPTDPTTSTSATFTFQGSDPAGQDTFECSLDSAAFAACQSPVTHNGLLPGPHIFAVRATDSVGNMDTTPASYTWTIGQVTLDQYAVDTDFKRFDGFDIVFSRASGSSMKINSTNPDSFHYQAKLINNTGTAISTANGNTATAIITVPGLPASCGGVPCSTKVASMADPAFSIRGHKVFHLYPHHLQPGHYRDDDDDDDMPVTVQYMTLAQYQTNGNSCADNSSYNPKLPSNGAPKCIKITGFTIPVKHGARLRINFQFRLKGTDGWNSNSQQLFYAGFPFRTTTSVNFGSNVQTASDVTGLVGAGKRTTAIGGYVFKGATPGAGYAVRLFAKRSDVSCTDNTKRVAQDVVDAEGFYFIWRTGEDQVTVAPNLPSGVQYAVQLCDTAGNQLGLRTTERKLQEREFEQIDFDLY